MRPFTRADDGGITSTDELLTSMKRNFGEIAAGVVELMESELALAKSELQHEVRKLVKAVPLVAIGLMFATYALGFVLLAGVYLLSLVVPAWAAALIVGVGSALIGGILFLVGWKRLSSVDLKPKQTIESVKENVVWLKSRLS